MDGAMKESASFFRRRHLVELHEQPWFPEVWRDLFRTGLGKAFVLFGLSRETSRVLGPFVGSHHPTEVLDLCSGSGELSCDAWRRAVSGENGAKVPDCHLVLSDLYPIPQRWAALHPGNRYIDLPVDARTIGADLPRTWMMLNCIHHFRPAELRELLQRTATSADGFIAVDRDARNWREMFMTIFVVPIAAAIITAFVIRPFRLRNVLWGLLISVIPLVAFLDGIVSNLRSYTVEELRSLIAECPSSFVWEVDVSPGGQGVPPMTYIRGTRRNPEADLPAEPRAS